jgi:hypothetical protein
MQTVEGKKRTRYDANPVKELQALGLYRRHQRLKRNTTLRLEV